MYEDRHTNSSHQVFRSLPLSLSLLAEEVGKYL